MVAYIGNSNDAHANGGCYRCGRGDSLVDFDVSIVGEGALALCKGCIAEAAEAADLLHNTAAWAELRATVLSLEAEVARAQEAEQRFLAHMEAARSFVLPADEVPDEPATRCPATTKSGAPCKGTPLDDGYCFAHAPAEVSA